MASFIQDADGQPGFIGTHEVVQTGGTSDEGQELELTVVELLEAFRVTTSIMELFASLMAPAVKNDQANLEKVRQGWQSMGSHLPCAAAPGGNRREDSQAWRQFERPLRCNSPGGCVAAHFQAGMLKALSRTAPPHLAPARR